MNIPLFPYALENLVSRDGFSSLVPRQPAHLHTQAGSGAYSRDSSRFPRRRPFIHLNRHTTSGQFRVYRVTQLCTDGIHCRKSVGKGPVLLKVVPVTGATILQVGRFTCRIVTYVEELVSVYICYSTGDWFNTPLSGFITSTYSQ